MRVRPGLAWLGPCARHADSASPTLDAVSPPLGARVEPSQSSPREESDENFRSRALPGRSAPRTPTISDGSCSAARLIGCSAARPLSCSAAQLLGCSAAGLLGCSAARLLGCSAARLLGRSAARPLSCSAARLLGCSAARLLGCSAARLAKLRCKSPESETSRTVRKRL